MFWPVGPNLGRHGGLEGVVWAGTEEEAAAGGALRLLSEVGRRGVAAAVAAAERTGAVWVCLCVDADTPSDVWQEEAPSRTGVPAAVEDCCFGGGAVLLATPTA